MNKQTTKLENTMHLEHIELNATRFIYVCQNILKWQPTNTV